MKILMTGGTGFLGKKLLQLLVDDDRVTEVRVISRRQRSHPASKVKVLRGDLSDPAMLVDPTHETIFSGIDCVVHLAGLYDFKRGLSANYIDNVVTTTNLVEKIKTESSKQPGRVLPIIYASTYAVGFGSRGSLREEPLTGLPPSHQPYAYTKAIAESVISNARIPSTIFRFGILVGDSKNGAIESLSGPYLFMKLAQDLARKRARSWLPIVPIPGLPTAVLPFVPVDVAAQALHEASFQAVESPSPICRFYGAYDSAHVSVEEFCSSVVREYLPHAKPKFLPKVPLRVLRMQQKLTQVPYEVFLFSSEQILLENQNYRMDFPNCKVPAFAEYRETFFKGFLAYSEGKH